MKLFPKSPKNYRLGYKAAEISYRFLRLTDARERFDKTYREYCGQPIAASAAHAMLTINLLLKNSVRVAVWRDRLKRGECIPPQPSYHRGPHGPNSLRRAMQLTRSKKWNRAAAALLKWVDVDPSRMDADKAIHNAAVCYEKMGDYTSAVRIYSRLWQQYPKSPLAREARWRAAVGDRQLFRLIRAVRIFFSPVTP